jgi:hypothetical protein
MSTPAAWYVKTKSGSAGPFTMEQLKATVDAEKLPRTAMLSQLQNGPWMPAGDFRQLFPEKEFTAEDLRPSDLVPDAVKKMSMTVYSSVGKVATGTTGLINKSVESIKENQRLKTLERDEKEREKNAKIRLLEQNRDAYLSQPDPQPQPSYPDNVRVIERHIYHSQPMNIQQVVNVNANNMPKHWNRDVAVFLSLICPGLGQMYKGQFANGLLWFLITVGCYVTSIPLGIFIHFCCIIGAASGSEYR